MAAHKTSGKGRLNSATERNDSLCSKFHGCYELCLASYPAVVVACNERKSTPQMMSDNHGAGA